MRYKKVTILLLSIANIVLMAHTILPHNHSQCWIYIIDSKCKDISLTHKHPCDTHEHDCKDESCYCTLKQFVIVPSQFRLYSEYSNHQSGYDLSKLFLDLLIIDNNEFSLFRIDVPPWEHIYFSSGFINYVGQNKGLRAPPII